MNVNLQNINNLMADVKKINRRTCKLLWQMVDASSLPNSHSPRLIFPSYACRNSSGSRKQVSERQGLHMLTL